MVSSKFTEWGDDLSQSSAVQFSWEEKSREEKMDQKKKKSTIAFIAPDIAIGLIMFGLAIGLGGFTPVAAVLEGGGLGLLVGLSAARMPKKPRLMAHIFFIVVGGAMFVFNVVPLLGMIFAGIGVGHLVSMLIPDH